jgi:hypothetical protein
MKRKQNVIARDAADPSFDDDLGAQFGARQDRSKTWLLFLRFWSEGGQPRKLTMSASNSSRTQSRLEKAAREGAAGGTHYEIEAKAIREKIGRLKMLRLAKDAANAGVKGPADKTAGKPAKAGARKP